MAQHQSMAEPGNGGYDREGVNVSKIVMITLTGVLIVTFSIVLVNEYFIKVKEEMIYEYDLSVESTELRELQQREEQVLTSYGLVDSTKQVYRIPIERAMELEVRDKAGKSR